MVPGGRCATILDVIPGSSSGSPGARQVMHKRLQRFGGYGYIKEQAALYWPV
jgi:hypothetical protein